MYLMSCSFDCIVDFTTLGRPAQKRNRAEHASNHQSTVEQPCVQQPSHGFQDSVSQAGGILNCEWPAARIGNCKGLRQPEISKRIIGADELTRVIIQISDDDIGHFLLSHPETANHETAVVDVQHVPPTRSEMLQACFGPCEQTAGHDSI